MTDFVIICLIPDLCILKFFGGQKLFLLEGHQTALVESSYLSL